MWKMKEELHSEKTLIELETPISIFFVCMNEYLGVQVYQNCHPTNKLRLPSGRLFGLSCISGILHTLLDTDREYTSNSSSVIRGVGDIPVCLFERGFEGSTRKLKRLGSQDDLKKFGKKNLFFFNVNVISGELNVCLFVFC